MEILYKSQKVSKAAEKGTPHSSTFISDLQRKQSTRDKNPEMPFPHGL